MICNVLDHTSARVTALLFVKFHLPLPYLTHKLPSPLCFNSASQADRFEDSKLSLQSREPTYLGYASPLKIQLLTNLTF